MCASAAFGVCVDTDALFVARVDPVVVCILGIDGAPPVVEARLSASGYRPYTADASRISTHRSRSNGMSEFTSGVPVDGHVYLVAVVKPKCGIAVHISSSRDQCVIWWVQLVSDAGT